MLLNHQDADLMWSVWFHSPLPSTSHVLLINNPLKVSRRVLVCIRAIQPPVTELPPCMMQHLLQVILHVLFSLLVATCCPNAIVAEHIPAFCGLYV